MEKNNWIKMWILTVLSATLMVTITVHGQSLLSFTKTLEFNLTDNDATYYSISDESNDFFFALCDPATYKDAQTVCKLVRKTLVSSALGFSDKTCDFNISNQKNDSGSINIKDHILIAWNHTHVSLIRTNPEMNQSRDKIKSLTIFIIRMADCSVVELSPNFTPAIEKGLLVAKNGKFFDIFYISDLYKENHCCRIRCDLNELFCDSAKCPRDTDTELGEFLWLAVGNSSLSNYHFSGDSLHAVSKNGTKTKVITHEFDLESTKWSCTYFKFSFCSKHFNGSATCRQHDEDGKLLLDAKLNLKNHLTHFWRALLFPHNLEESGSIVALIYGDHVFKVFLIFDGGKHVLLMDISNAAYAGHFKLLEDSTEICFKYIMRYQRDADVTYKINCIPKDLLQYL